jgi:AcrR family transcriptional regulator
MSYSEKQVQIMEMAEQLFAEKGFNGTSVRDIADKANVNLAMISYYFGSKDKLLEALFNYRGETTKITLENIIGKPGITSLEKVNLLIDHYINKFIDQQCFHRVMVREQVVNNTGTTAEMILQMKKRNYEIVARLIHEGQKKGEFKKGIDIPMIMSMMVGTVNHVITSKHYYRELNNVQDLSEEELIKQIRKKLGHYLKHIFKIMLTNEA